MERIQKLPFLAGSSAAIVTGIASYASGVGSQTIYLHMAVMMLVFFLIGIYARNTVLSIHEDIEKKKAEKELEEAQEQARLIEEQKLASPDKQKPQEHQEQEQLTASQPHSQLPKLDLVADDSDNDFKPFDISKAIRTKVNE